MTEERLAKLKSTACLAIDEAAGDLFQISQAIWSEPELSYQETKAHDRLTDFLETRGFVVTRQYLLNTGFKATLSSDHVTDSAGAKATSSSGHVGLMCEYDALPGVGHACGHNLIAEVALAAALGVKAAMTSLPPGSRISVIGTPAEEGGGGKIVMARAGAFDGLDAALMAHPYRRNEARPLILSRLALTAEFTAPALSSEHSDREAYDEAANPTDAAVTAYQAISCIRRRLPQHCMLHCILRDCSSPRPDVIPRRAVLEYYIRAPNEADFSELRRKLNACFEAAAMATDCRVTITETGPAYQSLRSNTLLSNAYAANLRQLGVKNCLETDSTEPAGSTDMGNVSHLLPSIHPMWRLQPDNATSDTPPNHSHEFTQLAGSPNAQADTLLHAKALAMTAIDILAASSSDEAGLRDRAWAEFKNERFK